MNNIFPVDEFSEPIWAAAAPDSAPDTDWGINRSRSEWAFQKLLEEYSPLSPPSAGQPQNVISPPSAAVTRPSGSKGERGDDDTDVVEILKPNFVNRNLHHRPSNSDEYQAILKSKLDLECAAVADALSKAAGVKFEDSPLQNGNPPGSQTHGLLKAQSHPEPGPAGSGVSELTNTQRKSGVQVRQTTSGSSREDSDDDDLEGDTETTENLDPADRRRERRMKSNRESARRSRRRKQAHMSELESQVGELRVEKTTLLNRLSGLNHQYDESAVDHRILKADIETLRARVKLAEETVKRVTGINPQLLSRPNVHNTGMPFVSNPLDTTMSAAMPLQQKANPFLHQPVHGSLGSNTIANPQINIGGKNATATSLQQRSALEHVQNQLGLDGMQQQSGNGISRPGTMPGWESGPSYGVSRKNKPN